MMGPVVSNDRLTRQELSWLLAQEARGAAKALREGVSMLKAPELREKSAPVETTLDALEDAIGKLSELQAGARGGPRRGRIDLAALLCQVAPSARIAMQPGDGTEVFGEENELRRMLHVLVNQTNSTPSEGPSTACPEVRIRRENEWVKISVELGPDVSSTAELERRWLSRMATRHGGRLELEPGTQTIVLPAEGSGGEVLELRKELEQAQQLGEAYARELAAVFSTATQESTNEARILAPGEATQRLALLKGFSTALLRPLRTLLEATRSDAAVASSALGEQAELTHGLNRRITATHELVTELRRLTECPLDETARTIDVVMLARETAAGNQTRAARQGVQVRIDAPPKLELVSYPGALGLLVRTMLDHAVVATPRGGVVTLRLRETQGKLEMLTEDGGPAIPEAARQDILKNRADPSSFGRPADLSLLIADAAASYLGSSLTLSDNSENLTVTRVLLGSESVAAE